MLQIWQGWIRKYGFHPSATLNLTSRNLCNEESPENGESSCEEEPNLDRKPDKNHEGNENTYVVDKIVQHTDYGSCVRYAV